MRRLPMIWLCPLLTIVLTRILRAGLRELADKDTRETARGTRWWNRAVVAGQIVQVKRLARGAGGAARVARRVSAGTDTATAGPATGGTHRAC